MDELDGGGSSENTFLLLLIVMFPLILTIAGWIFGSVLEMRQFDENNQLDR